MRRLRLFTGAVPFLVLFLAGFLSIYFSRHSRLESERWLIAPLPYGETAQRIVLHQDMDVEAFTDSIFSVGLIRHPDVVLWPARILGWKRLRTGRYLIGRDETIRQALDRMGQGVQDPVDVVIQPGMTVEGLATHLSEVLKSDSASFAQCITGRAPECVRPGVAPSHLLGRMLPDTYSVYWTHPPSQVVGRIVTQFDEKTGSLPTSPAGFDHLGLDLDDIVTLASIVEWETSKDDERARISRLYLNRLDRRMRLQADPTVVFAVGEKRRLFYRDYLTDHPYNTYQIYGLPPGPVTNPSMASILAVLQPEVHDDLYMVATPDGYHEFNATYSEHQKAARRWQEWISEQARLRRLEEALASESADTLR